MPRPRTDVWEFFNTDLNCDGKKSVTCKYCKIHYNYGNATKMKNHLMACKQAPLEVKTRFGNGDNTSNFAQTFHSGEAPLKRLCLFKPSRNDVTSPFKKAHSTDPLDIKLDLLLEPHEEQCQDNDPFDHNDSIERLEHFERAKLKVEEHGQDERVQIETEDLTALSLIIDIWTNTTGRTVINSIITAPDPVSCNSIYLTDDNDIEERVFQEVVGIIDEFGSDKFVAIVTESDDNSALKCVWSRISDMYPNITIVGCTSHSLNLIYTDFAKTIVVKRTLRKVKSVIESIKNDPTALASLNKTQIEKYGKTSVLKVLSLSRCIGDVMALQCYMKNKIALEQLDYFETEETILNEETWKTVGEIIKLLSPLSEAIRKSETEQLAICDVPAIFKRMIESIRAALDVTTMFNEREQSLIINFFQDRKRHYLKPIHLAAYLLDPRGGQQDLEDDVVPVAVEYISTFAKKLNLDAATVLANLALFRTRTGYFDKKSAMWSPVQLLEPRVWWQTFAPTQLITKVAVIILGIPPCLTMAGQIGGPFGSASKSS